jgi:hypothetical protein
MQLERMILAGVVQKVHRNFRLASEPTFISSNDRWRLADRIRSADGKPVMAMPAVFLQLKGLELNTDSYNPGLMMRHGMYSPSAAGNDVVTKYPMLPVYYKFDLIHISQDFFDMLLFSKQYMLATRDRSGLNFNLMFDGIPIDIRVSTSDQVSVPEKDNALDVANVYELQAELTVSGWCSVDVEEAMQVDIIQRGSSTVRTTDEKPSA